MDKIITIMPVENIIEQEIKVKYVVKDGKQSVLLRVKQDTPLIPLHTSIYGEFKKGMAITISYAGMMAGHQANKALMYAREKLCREDKLDFAVQMYKHFTVGKKYGDKVEIFYIRIMAVPFDAICLGDYQDG